jgi:hypothetical protein
MPHDVATRAAVALGGAPLAIAVRVIIALKLLTSVSAMVMAGPRVYARMAEDGVLPTLFGVQGEVPRAAGAGSWLSARSHSFCGV